MSTNCYTAYTKPEYSTCLRECVGEVWFDAYASACLLLIPLLATDIVHSSLRSLIVQIALYGLQHFIRSIKADVRAIRTPRVTP